MARSRLSFWSMYFVGNVVGFGIYVYIHIYIYGPKFRVHLVLKVAAGVDRSGTTVGHPFAVGACVFPIF